MIVNMIMTKPWKQYENEWKWKVLMVINNEENQWRSSNDINQQ